MMLDSIDLAAEAEWAGDQFEWVDEFEWDAIAQEQERGLDGALLVSEAVKHYGRPITLRANGGVWLPLAVVRQLEVLRDQLGRVMPLTLEDGRAFYVIFNRVGGAPLEATPLERMVNPPDDHPYEVTLRLITVAPPAV